MPSLLNDGLLVLLQKSGGVVVVASCMLWGSIVIASLLRWLEAADLALWEYLSISMGGWLVAVVPFSGLVYFAGAAFGIKPGLEAAAVILAAVACGLLLLASRHHLHWTIGGILATLGLLGLLFLTACARLAFAARTALPLYFDSAEHYRIARELGDAYLHGSFATGLTWPTPTYYHFGFHILMALMTVIPGQDLATVMLVSGQLVLAAIPFSLMYLVQRETSSMGAGFMTVILGIAGWYMPAFAVNWGKYPALFSLPAVMFCLDAAYLAGKHEGRQRTILFLFAAVGAISAFVLHTRAIGLIAIGLVAWWLAGRWVSGPAVVRGIVLGLLALITAAIVGGAVVKPELAPVFDPYLGSGLIVTILAAVLALFGFREYPRLAFASLVASAALLLALSIPVPGIRVSPLLDRPLVEMILFVPLVLMAGCGIAATGKSFSQVPNVVRSAGVVVLGLALVAHALIHYSWYPSDCCQLVHSDDLVALDWIGSNLAEGSVMAISQDALRDAPAPYDAMQAGTDAGTWITALTGRRTVGLPRSADFAAAATLDQLCIARVAAVYVGSPGFDRAGLDSQANWYHAELLLPGAAIYQVTGCKLGGELPAPKIVKTQ